MTRTYYTAMENQPDAQIDVYQGENPAAWFALQFYYQRRHTA